MTLRLIAGAARAQLQMTRHNVEDLMRLLTAPLATIVSMAILQYSTGGRILPATRLSRPC